MRQKAVIGSARKPALIMAALSRLMQGVKGCIGIEKAEILCKYFGLELKPKTKGKRG
jgi:hypothetical protein